MGTGNQNLHLDLGLDLSLKKVDFYEKWNFATKILHEINFEKSRNSKPAFFVIIKALNLVFRQISSL